MIIGSLIEQISRVVFSGPLGEAWGRGPLHERVSTKRLEKSLRVVVNSAIFRSSGQNLTTRGTYTEIASRLIEPVLLGFAALAIRGRVKR